MSRTVVTFALLLSAAGLGTGLIFEAGATLSDQAKMTYDEPDRTSVHPVAHGGWQLVTFQAVK